MLPSAVSDSHVHNILPNKIDTDFQFSRASSATRVNHQGLIEDVGYFGPELVQNGNFSELGSELVTNGDFSNGTNDWNFTDANGQVGIYFGRNEVCEIDFTNTSTIYASQNNILTNTKSYKITLDYYIPSTNTSANYIQIRLGNTSSSSALSPNLNVLDNWTSATLYGVSNGTDLYIYTPSGAIGDKFYIDNISVKQVDPDDDWILDTNWSYGSNKVIGSATTSEIQQDVVLPSGKQYLTSFTIEDYVSGDVRIRFRGGTTVNGTNRQRNGTYTQILTSTGHTNIKIDGGTAFTGSVTNVSVVEVIGDKPRLDYEPLNPTCPHLLLEPQSTNLVTFSENFNSNLYTETNISVTSNSIISPDGTKNASMLTDDSTNGQHRLTTSALFAADGNNRCWSIFVKKGTSRYCAFNHVAAFSSSVNTIVFDFDTATYSTIGTTAYMDEVFPPQNYGNGWYKISFRSDINSSAYNRLNIGLSSGPTYSDASYAGTGDTVYVWGGQVEQQDYVTSYIPTAGSQETRVGETCTNAGNLNTFNSEEGVLYAEMAALADDLTFRSISINDGTNNEAAIIRFRTNSNRINGLIRDGGSAVNNINFDVTDITDFNKVAYKFKTGDCALFINGTEVATGTSAFTLSPLVSLDFNNGNPADDLFYGKVKSLATYNRALTDTELYTITSTQYSAYSGMVAALGNYTIPC